MEKKIRAEEISEIISRKIISGELEPGTPLKVLTLTKEFGVSQAPVREALRILQGEGYVISKPNCGCKVTEHTLEELKETFEIRFILEQSGLIENIQSCKNEPLMTELYKQFELVEDRESFIEVDYRLHEYIANIPNNSMLLKLWKQVMNKSRIAHKINQDNWQLKPALKLHKKLCRAIFEADLEEITTLMKKHYNK